MEEREAEGVSQDHALGDGGGLSGVPGNRVAGVGFVVVGRREVGGDDMNAVAAGGGVEDEAGGWVGVIGYFGALVCGEND